MKERLIMMLSLVFLLSACGPQTFYYGAADQSLPQLVVQAEANVAAIPDQLKLRLGVITQETSADLAMAENNRQMAAVVAQLRELGIDEADLATGQFQIHPEWSRPPRPAPANWQREIIGYQVSNELLITTTQVELAGKLLSLAQQAGANQIGGLQFGLADPTAHRQKAIEVATEKAIRKAKTMAAAAGVELGTVQSISLNQNGGGGQPRLMMAEARLASAEPVPIATGKVEVSAAVTMVYQIINSGGSSQ